MHSSRFRFPDRAIQHAPARAQPLVLHIVNGAPDGSCRVSSALVKVDNVVIATPADFNQEVDQLQAQITITEASVLTVLIRGCERAFLEISIGGRLVSDPGFIHVLPGSFQMGSPPDELDCDGDDETQHTVTLTRGFLLCRHEVTEQEWDAVMGQGVSISQLPKDNVSWDMAVEFCNQRSLAEGLTPAYVIGGPNGDVVWDQTADGYRLPTEAEWEFACRAASTATDPVHDTGLGSPRACRGGYWGHPARDSRSANRERAVPTRALEMNGFRVARSQ